MHMAAEADEIFSSIALPSGRILSNRLVKVAMLVKIYESRWISRPNLHQVALYEHLAKLHGGPPNNWHRTLYSNWANHDWGMIITGNVQVSPHHLSLARDLVIPAELSIESVRPFKELAAAMHGARKEKDRPVAIMQLSHAGRQSPNILGGRFPFFRPLAPSNIRLGSSLKNNNFLSDLIHRIMFQVPRDMSPADIDEVVESFVRGARLASQAGYDGVELHVAHGCEFQYV
jgi:2,4-dienoyl-CoA reductase-like NADH-dependent reductase (Old Yellow Enzyme family)